MKSLKQLFDTYGADKGHKHHYDNIYEKLFSPKRNEKINFLEVGIWKGLGMAALRDYFPNGEIYGIDIFTRIKPEQVHVLGLNRTHWIKGDSTNIAISGLLADQFGVQFDYILDDGAHYPEANKLTFRHLNQFLKPGGMYIIEDVWPLQKMSAKDLSHPWIRQNLTKYNMMENEKFLYELENSGMKITYYDNRALSGEPDSVVIVLEKPE